MKVIVFQLVCISVFISAAWLPSPLVLLMGLYRSPLGGLVCLVGFFFLYDVHGTVEAASSPCQMSNTS